MKKICDRRCLIGEGPIWNEFEKRLYFVNALEKEIYILNIETSEIKVRNVYAYAIAFDKENRKYISTESGVYRLNDDDTLSEIYDTKKYHIAYGNDMKVGPDGRLYVGTISAKHKGISEDIDGKLYAIDTRGNVNLLLNGLRVSNGLEWSIDKKRFYHTDSATHLIKEYAFNAALGSIEPTGRQIEIPGVDGFTIDQEDDLYVACWGRRYIAIVDTHTMAIKRYIDIATAAPASCSFCGKAMDLLAVTTVTHGRDLKTEIDGGKTLLLEGLSFGRAPFLFGEEKI